MTKIVITGFILFVLYAAYILRPSSELGSFEKIRSAGEINQSVNVLIVKEKGFARDASGKITAFFARDKFNAEATVHLSEPANHEIANANIVTIFGHMHDDNFMATRIDMLD